MCTLDCEFVPFDRIVKGLVPMRLAYHFKLGCICECEVLQDVLYILQSLYFKRHL